MPPIKIADPKDLLSDFVSGDQSPQIDVSSFGELCLNVPLYKVFDMEGESDIYTIGSTIAFHSTFDGYCAQCGENTTFRYSSSEKLGKDFEKTAQENKELTKQNFVGSGDHAPTLENCAICIQCTCARNAYHRLIIVFFIKDGTLQKIGQYPSLTDTSIGELKKYRAVLENDMSKELRKALGLAAHDVGIGAFVYLRRVFERLIVAKQREAIAEGLCEEKDFKGKKMNERIDILRSKLPKVLVDANLAYPVLSKGIHELEEKECLTYFPVLRDITILILEEDLAKTEREKHIAATNKSLQDIASKLSSS